MWHILYNNSFYIAASPDGIATCKCHGKKILIEIKCPDNIKYCRRYKSVSVPSRK